MHCEPESTLQDPMFFVAQWQKQYANQNMPRDFFPLLHSVAEYLRVSGQAQRAMELLQCEKSMGADRYLGHRLEHARQQVLTMFEAGERQKARHIVHYYAARPYLFENMEQLGFFLFCRSVQALEEHDAPALAQCVTLMVRTPAGARNAYLLRVIHQAGNLKHFFASAAGLGWPTRVFAAVFWGAQRLADKGVVAGMLGRGLHFCLGMARTLNRLKGGNTVWMLQKRAVQPAAVPTTVSIDTRGKKDKRPILVTRAMGGIGDILMMTPGLKALHRKYPDREIHFAVPKGFHALLAHNPDIVLKDINAEILHQEDYFALYNMTECPASRVESATLPNVRQNRIDIFSKAMGIPQKLQALAGRKPVYIITEEEKTWARHFFAERGLSPQQCIAVQPYAADSYKDYPHMEQLVTRLAKNQPVLVFHGSALRGFEQERVFKIDAYPLRQSIALLSMCAQLIAVDSAFVHIAAALDVKTVALFGPTDGAVFTKYYPKCTVINEYRKATCRACWRNQGIVCAKNRTLQSRCLEMICPQKIN